MNYKDFNKFTKEYPSTGFTGDSVLSDPLEQFRDWFQQAISSDIPEPNVMTLAKVSKAGKPSARMVLLKITVYWRRNLRY